MPISLTGPVQILNQLLGNNSQQNMNFVPSDKMRSSLRMNQTLTGIVEQDLGHGKYLVQIHGENLVAESKTPLKLNDIIHGRVVGIGDKVELQRIYNEQAAANKAGATKQNLEHLYAFGKPGYRAAVILQNYLVNLNADEQQALISALKNGAELDTISLTAVVLNKLGLPVTQESLNTLYPVLSSQLKQKFNLQNITAELAFTSAENIPGGQETIKHLAEFVRNVVDIFPHVQAHTETAQLLGKIVGDSEKEFDLESGVSDHDSQSSFDDFDASRILLNSQSGGSVSHRVSTIPFMLDGQLVEVDVALFSQKQSQGIQANEHKRIVLSLNLDTLGKVEAEINIIGKHARININTENNIITNALVKYMPELKGEFESNQFKIDELSYGVKQSDSIGNVIGSVVEHYITQDSLSRLY